MAFTIHALAESDRAQQIDGSRLQHSGSNPPQDMLAALPFQHNAIDAVSIQYVGEKQSGRPPPMIAARVRIAVCINRICV